MSLLLKSCESLGALLGGCSEPCASGWDGWYRSSSRCMTEQEGQAMSTRDEARRRRNVLAVTMTEVMEEKISRDLEERLRCADGPVRVGKLGDCDLCRGDVQHRVVLTCGTCKTLVCVTCCRWEKRESAEKQDHRSRRLRDAFSHPRAVQGGIPIPHEVRQRICASRRVGQGWVGRSGGLEDLRFVGGRGRRLSTRVACRRGKSCKAGAGSARIRIRATPRVQALTLRTKAYRAMRGGLAYERHSLRSPTDGVLWRTEALLSVDDDSTHPSCCECGCTSKQQEWCSLSVIRCEAWLGVDLVCDA